jgi:uncharacterized LabA/DUF88 family protein
MTAIGPQYAILLDGGFVVKKLQTLLGRFPSADDIEEACNRIRSHVALRDMSLLRIYFYNAPPAKDKLVNPLDRTTLNLSSTPTMANYTSLHDKLELKADFALRLGECVAHGWQLKQSVQADIRRAPRMLTAADFAPNIEQKGVDLRIGLDIARLAIRGIVRVLVVVTGDSDFVPALKFARREGVRVYLDAMGHGVRRELKAHADRVIEASHMIPPPPLPAPGIIAPVN